MVPVCLSNMASHWGMACRLGPGRSCSGRGPWYAAQIGLGHSAGDNHTWLNNLLYTGYEGPTPFLASGGNLSNCCSTGPLANFLDASITFAASDPAGEAGQRSGSGLESAANLRPGIASPPSLSDLTLGRAAFPSPALTDSGQRRAMNWTPDGATAAKIPDLVPRIWRAGRVSRRWGSTTHWQAAP